MGLENWNLDRITEAAKAMHAEIASLKASLQSAKEGFGIVQAYVEPPFAKYREQTWAGEYWWQAEKSYEQSKEICTANDAVKQNNFALLHKIEKLLTGAGINRSTRRLKGRSGYKTEEVNLEWYTLLLAAIPAPQYTTEWLERKWKEVQDIRTGEEKKREQERQVREKEQERRRREQIKTAALVVSAQELGLDPNTASLDEMLDVVRSKDKYLDLAVAMADTRSDWSEGFYRVRDAVGRFEIVTPRDKEIYEAVHDAAYGEEDDGRVFRDMGEYSYDNLFAMADQRWVEVFNKLRSIEQIASVARRPFGAKTAMPQLRRTAGRSEQAKQGVREDGR